MNPIHSRVLLVGSTARSRELFRALLSELHVSRIDEAGDALGAFELHHQHPYDLIVSVWDLPRVSGLELLRSIRKGTVRCRTSVVLATGEATVRRTVEALHAGANGLIELPLDVKRTREKLKRIITSLPEHSARVELRQADAWSPAA